MTIEYLCEPCLRELELLATSVQKAPPPICPRKTCECGAIAVAIVQHDQPALAERRRRVKPADAIAVEVVRVYHGSNGDSTTALYNRLEKLWPAGAIAVNLFRASKNSARAKVYRGGGYKGMAYDRKQWAMDNLAKILLEHAEACGIRWGWGEDQKQELHKWVLYVDLPTGQVSFHTASRGAGLEYAGAWDGALEASAGRICRWCAQLLEEKVHA